MDYGNIQCRYWTSQVFGDFGKNPYMMKESIGFSAHILRNRQSRAGCLAIYGRLWDTLFLFLGDRKKA